MPCTQSGSARTRKAERGAVAGRVADVQLGAPVSGCSGESCQLGTKPNMGRTQATPARSGTTPRYCGTSSQVVCKHVPQAGPACTRPGRSPQVMMCF